MEPAIALLLGAVVAAASTPPVYSPLTNKSASTWQPASAPVTLLFQNNLNASDNANHVGALLLGFLNFADAATGCANLSESLLSPSTIKAHQNDFLHALSYDAYASQSSTRTYFIGDNSTVTVKQGQSLSYAPRKPNDIALPVLCTQSAYASEPWTSYAAPSNEVTVVDTNSNSYTGFRNLKSFRFLGIRYAPQPDRFTYSKVSNVSKTSMNATAYGNTCKESEDCFFLNIQTPYLPRANAGKGLKPVVMWIHGGAFEAGSGSDPTYDGGNLASREDVVVVTINYRLGSLGFLAVPNTTARGNYGIADQETALQWIFNNIATFGGDPNQITIMGQSAGAQSVRAILGSPPAFGTFSSAIALSNVGPMLVGKTPPGDYVSIEAAFAGNNGQSILDKAGCNQTDLQQAVACLQTVNSSTIGDVGPPFILVQDGHYIDSPVLNVGKKPGLGQVANVPVIFGNVENDGATFLSYPKTDVPSLSAGLQSILSINQSFADAILASELYQADNSNITAQAFNISQQVLTDRAFRCFNQGTVKSGLTTGAFNANSYYYQFDRVEGGLNLGLLPNAPVTPGYPNGNPNLPYYKLHASEFPWVFGNYITLRDADDLYAQRVGVSYFATFIKSHKTAASPDYLKARGYETVIQGLADVGSWQPATSTLGNVALIDFPPAKSVDYLYAARCALIGVPLDRPLL